MPNNVILKTTNLQKSFSGIIAAEDINITVKESEIIGIIGANINIKYRKSIIQ